MKFWLINSLRTIVYVSYFAILAYGIWTGIYTGGDLSATLGLTADSAVAQFLDVVICFLGAFLVASLVCGLIMTIMDIRDDINDRLPDAQHDN